MGHSKLLPMNFPPVAKGGILGMLSGAGGNGGGVFFKEIGRDEVSTGSTATELEVTGLDVYPYLQVFAYVNSTGGAVNCTWSAGDNTGYLGNYSEQYQENGGTRTTSTGGTTSGTVFNQGSSEPFFVTGFISNIADIEKMAIWQCVSSSSFGASTAPDRCNTFGKFTNNAQITRLKLNTSSVGSAGSGSFMVVAGYDPSNPSGTNLWQQLASEELETTADELEVTSLSSEKKFLMIQVYIPDGSAHHGYIYYNSDDSGSNNNYCRRGNVQANGSDFENAPDDEVNFTHNTDFKKYWTSFWLNVSNTVKKGVSTYSDTDTNKTMQLCYKWDNTSNQIGGSGSYAIKVYNQNAGSSDFPVGTKITVWGFD